MPDLVFLVHNKRNFDPRERRLALSEARSHAARVAHTRRSADDVTVPTRKKKKTNSLPTTPHTVCAHGDTTESGPLPPEAPEPSLVLYKGNSDPFTASSGITASPRINQILSFLRDCYIPTTFPEEPPWIRNTRGSHFFDDQARLILVSSPDRCDILPYLTILAQQAGGGDLQHEAIATQLQVIRRAQQAMTDGTSDDNFLLLVKSLFMSAMAEHSMVTARSHGMVLANLLQRRVEDVGWSQANIDLFTNCLFSVLMLSHMTLQKSVWDVGEQTDKLLKDTVQPVLDYLKPLHRDLDDRLEPCVTDIRLRRCFNVLNGALWLWEQKPETIPKIPPETIARYLSLQFNIASIRLIDLFVCFEGHLNEKDPKLSPDEQAKRLSQGLLGISLSAFLATFVANPKIGHRYIWQKHTGFLSKMRSLLTYRLDDGTVFEQSPHRTKYATALLLAYWVGATWEHAQASPTEDLLHAWYTYRFVSACRVLKLGSWKAVEDVLVRFTTVSYASPSGSSWVDGLLRSTGRRGGVEAAGNVATLGGPCPGLDIVR
jgi:hypothetical protein